MAGLTTREKKQLHAAKQKLITNVASAMKLQNLTSDESALLETVLTNALTDRIGKFNIRYNEVTRDFYIVCGILYNHMNDSKLYTPQPYLLPQGFFPDDEVPI